MARYRVDPAVVARAQARLTPLPAAVAQARTDLLRLQEVGSGTVPGATAAFWAGLHDFVAVWGERLRTDVEVLEGAAATLAVASTDYATTDAVVVPDGGAR